MPSVRLALPEGRSGNGGGGRAGDLLAATINAREECRNRGRKN
jgi:hypothetical protein